jgi:hypothetical protein
MLLTEELKPKSNSKIRIEALKNIKNRSKFRFKLQKTSPKEFNFHLLLRESQRTSNKKSPLNTSFINPVSKALPTESYKIVRPREEDLECGDMFELYKPDYLPHIKFRLKK